MRKRDIEKIERSIKIDDEPKQSSPISVRPYEEDYKKLEEISEETGQKKAAIVRHMIHFTLNEKRQHFSPGRVQEKLDWLVRSGRLNEIINGSLKDQLAEVHDSIQRMEVELENIAEVMAILRSIMSEIYSMSSMSVSSLNLLFTKLIEYASPDQNDRKQSVVIASTAMAELIDHAVTDLRRCLLFHEHIGDLDTVDRSYLETKIQVLKQRIESSSHSQNLQPEAP